MRPVSKGNNYPTPTAHAPIAAPSAALKPRRIPYADDHAGAATPRSPDVALVIRAPHRMSRRWPPSLRAPRGRAGQLRRVHHRPSPAQPERARVSGLPSPQSFFSREDRGFLLGTKPASQRRLRRAQRRRIAQETRFSVGAARSLGALSNSSLNLGGRVVRGSTPRGFLTRAHAPGCYETPPSSPHWHGAANPAEKRRKILHRCTPTPSSR